MTSRPVGQEGHCFLVEILLLRCFSHTVCEREDCKLYGIGYAQQV